MSISLPIFPGFKSGQSPIIPPSPVRGPTWNFKESLQFSNYRQKSVSGRTNVVKYYSNPLHLFEWTYGVLLNDPTSQNTGFYANTAPIPATDYEILMGFYSAMQGGGNEFAFTPPDNLIGPTIGSVGTVQVIAPDQVIFSTLPGGSATLAQPYVGKYIFMTHFTAATFLNAKYALITSVNTGSNTITVRFTHANYGPTGSDVGTLILGQVLGTPDANNNVELVNTLGAYPTISGQVYNNASTLSNESVQLIDTSTLAVYDSTGATLGFTLFAPTSTNPPLLYAPYPGYVIHFSSTPTNLPLSAKFSLYYQCRFTEDLQEFENFSAMLWLASSVKFEQVRV